MLGVELGLGLAVDWLPVGCCGELYPAVFVVCAAPVVTPFDVKAVVTGDGLAGVESVVVLSALHSGVEQ